MNNKEMMEPTTAVIRPTESASVNREIIFYNIKHKNLFYISSELQRKP
jgi:hypothetical protein